MSKPADIIDFACNWDGLSCIEAAAHAGLCYSASVKVIRISCLSRLHLGLILKAFELGADGVLVMTCPEGKCHFLEGNLRAKRRVKHAKEILAEIKLESDRLQIYQRQNSVTGQFEEIIDDMRTKIKNIGPSPLKTGGN